ncbi:MAG: alpha/beta hydrolase, partial [Verrucomicrobiae bacterium]|nr:alpha/beta hydrolase [Verrucomicrobiae bacterium]
MKRESVREWIIGALWVIAISGGLLWLLAWVTGTRGDKATHYVYKQTGGTSLMISVYQPDDWKPSDRRPCVVWFFGGGYETGGPAQMAEAAKRMARRGLVAVTADYRVRLRHGSVTPLDAVKDARSAVRWVKLHADQLGITGERIAVGGNSSGGQLALACDLLDGLDESTDNVEISPSPAALVLFNPLVDFDIPMARERAADLDPGLLESLSPITHLTTPLPPTLILHGEADRIIPIDSVKAFVEKAKGLGSPSIE